MRREKQTKKQQQRRKKKEELKYFPGLERVWNPKVWGWVPRSDSELFFVIPRSRQDG